MGTLLGGYGTVVATTVVGLILIPIFLSHLGSELYGAWLGSGGILAWLAVLDMGLASLMIQRIAEAHGRGDASRVGEYLSTGLLLQLVVVALLIGAAVVVSQFFPRWMGIMGSDAQALSTAFVVAAVANGLNILNNGLVGFLRALQITFLPSAVAVVGVGVGAVATVLLLRADVGVVSIPAGLAVGVGFQLLINFGHSLATYWREIGASLRPSRNTAKDFVAVSGPMFASKVSTAAISRSDAALIAILLRPELATAYVLTRKAADVVLLLLNLIGGAAFAPFAHLVGENQRKRAVGIHQQIMQVYLAAGVVMVGTFLATNAAFVTLWVGSENYLGDGLNMLIGMAVLMGGTSAILNYLFGATGRIATSAWINMAEGSVRFAMMVALLMSIGVAGLPVAAIVTAPLAGWFSARETFRELDAEGRSIGGGIRAYATHVAVLAGGALIGLAVTPATWIGFVCLAAMFAAVGGIGVLAAAPAMREAILPRAL